MRPPQDEPIPGAPPAQCEEGGRRDWSSSTGAALTLVRSGPAAARGAANPPGRVPGRRGRRDLGRGAGEIGLGLTRGGGGRRGGAGGGGGGGERKETGFKQWD